MSGSHRRARDARRRVAAAVTALLVTLCGTCSASAQDRAEAGRWSGQFATGVSFETGNHQQYGLDFAPELRWDRRALRLDVRADASWMISRDTRAEPGDDGRVVRRTTETSDEHYDVEPSLQMRVRRGLAAVFDYDWRRNTDNGITHHHLVTVGVQGDRADATGSRTVAARAGFLYESETDGDLIRVPAAALNVQRQRQLAARGSVDGTLEVISNLRLPSDLRLRLNGRVQAPLTAKWSLTVDLRSEYRNRASELLVDPQSGYGIDQVPRFHVVIEPKISWNF